MCVCVCVLNRSAEQSATAIHVGASRGSACAGLAHCAPGKIATNAAPAPPTRSPQQQHTHTHTHARTFAAKHRHGEQVDPEEGVGESVKKAPDGKKDEEANGTAPRLRRPGAGGGGGGGRALPRAQTDRRN